MTPARVQARLTSAVRKKSRGRKTTFTTTGRLLLPSGTASSACNGFVSVQIKHKTKTVSRRRVALKANCTYTSAAAILNSRLRGSGRDKVIAVYQGNARLLTASAGTKFA